MPTKYSLLTKSEIERIFAEDVLGWYIKTFDTFCESCREPEKVQRWMERDFEDCPTLYRVENPKWKINLAFHPLENISHAWLGIDELSGDVNEIEVAWYNRSWQVWVFGKDIDIRAFADDPQEAIVEACIRIKRPDLFVDENV